MRRYVKWFVNLLPAQDAWVREVAKENNLKGVEVIRGTVERAMIEDPARFRRELKKARLDSQERTIHDQIDALRQKEQQVLKEREELEKTLQSRDGKG